MVGIFRVNRPNGFSLRAPTDVNSFDSPGNPNVHHNSGGPRIAAIGGYSFLLGPNGGIGERIYRSTDGGNTWILFDSSGLYSGAMLPGKNKNIYRFWIDRGVGTIYMQKFAYNAANAGSASTVYSNSALTSTGIVADYPMLGAHVDVNGNVYVITHYGVTNDVIYVFKSTDEGATWSGPTQVSDNTAHNTYCHLESDANGTLYAVWRTEADDIRFCRSDDGGATWTATISRAGTGGATLSNPTICTDGNGVVLMTVQGTNLSGHSGVFFSSSSDKGVTWGSWILVEDTCGYGDPGFAIDGVGAYYIAMRSSKNTGITSGTCGDQSKFRLMRSTDFGATWNPVDGYYSGERSGTRNHLRYTSFFNYGGPLEWSWCQYTGGQAALPTFYDRNNLINIRAHQ